MSLSRCINHTFIANIIPPIRTKKEAADSPYSLCYCIPLGYRTCLLGNLLMPSVQTMLPKTPIKMLDEMILNA